MNDREEIFIVLSDYIKITQTSSFEQGRPQECQTTNNILNRFTRCGPLQYEF